MGNTLISGDRPPRRWTMGTVPVDASVFAVDLVFIITYQFVHVGTDPMGSGDRPHGEWGQALRIWVQIGG